jgi:hypothetical protein
MSGWPEFDQLIDCRQSLLQVPGASSCNHNVQRVNSIMRNDADANDNALRRHTSLALGMWYGTTLVPLAVPTVPYWLVPNANTCAHRETTIVVPIAHATSTICKWRNERTTRGVLVTAVYSELPMTLPQI